MSKHKIKLIDHERIDWQTVENYLRHHINEIPNEPLKVDKFTEGYSNITYLLKFGDWQSILRRPPFGKIPPRAHDMYREYRILKNLHPVFKYAPKPYLYCEDQAIMDKHFYVMEKKDGYVIDDSLPIEYGNSIDVGPIISENVIKVLVELQSIDYKEVGLGNFGKPDGYLERQVNGWMKRYANSKTDNYTVLRELEKWLVENRPVYSDATIVHNDFKLNNLVFHIENVGEIIGVLDWELSTIGDPLTDIGSAVAYWGEENDPDMGINIITDEKGFYSRRELIEAYAKRSGRDMTHITFYVTFGFYKLAVILQQIYYRWKLGEIQDDRFKDLNRAVSNIFEMADNTRKNKIL